MFLISPTLLDPQREGKAPDADFFRADQRAVDTDDFPGAGNKW